VSEAPATQPGPPEKGVADVLKEAYDLYRKNAGALIMMCAVLFVPASFVKSCAVSAITGPSVAAEVSREEMNRYRKEDLDDAQRRLQEAYQHHADKATIERLQAELDHVKEEVRRRAALEMSSFTGWILERLGALVNAFLFFGLMLPLAIGAMSIAAADRLLGGQAGWREVWALVGRRLVPWLTAALPAAIVVAFGYVFFYIPGVVLGLLFAFISPVVLFERRRGQPALQRSAQLIATEWLRPALMFIIVAVLCWFASWVTNLVVPRAAVFLGSLLGDLATMVVLPVPLMGLFLLYLDVRRKADGYTNERLRADLDALKKSAVG
jgi:hypothetical protein